MTAQTSSLEQQRLAQSLSSWNGSRKRACETLAALPRTLEPTKQAMFVVYLDDNEKKLAVFKDLADRAEILLDILNSKFHPKRVQLDKDEGYRIFSHDNQPLKPDWLSSGEQHEMVLLHNLLFRVKPGSLLLIDEPELSLHVTWQNEFLADLIRVAKKVGFDAIVATHSPYIVGSRCRRGPVSHASGNNDCCRYLHVGVTANP